MEWQIPSVICIARISVRVGGGSGRGDREGGVGGGSGRGEREGDGDHIVSHLRWLLNG